MDFRNFCQHIDVDSIRAKIPQLPSIPAMPQIKLPKSMPKLRSRRIFKSSREDIRKTSPKSVQQLAPAPAIPPSEFINHSPHRISTISSLMNQGAAERRNQSTYCSADSIDDDYPTARQIERSFSRPIILSPIKADSPRFNTTKQDVAGSSTSVKMSLTEKLQKGYKDISEFRIKHIFAKKTVVRKDNINVEQYVQRFNEDREHDQQEQEKRDRKIAENYRFKFKVSRQNTGHTNSMSSNDSHVCEPKAEQTRKTSKSVSDDESGMEASPPKRKGGIAATRFAEDHNAPLQRNMSEDSTADANNELEEYEVAIAAPNQSTLWAIKDSRATDTEQEKKSPTKDQKSGGYKERMRRLTSYVSPHEDSADAETKTVEATSGGAKMLSKIRSFGKRNESEEVERTSGGERKRKAPLTPQQSEEKDETKADNPMGTIRQNFRRFQKSIKRQQPSAATDESEDEDTTASNRDTRVPTKTEKLTARLRRFKSRETSLDDMDNVSPKKDETNKKSPLHAAITNKLQTWKKSFKKKPAESGTNTGDESSPEKQKRSDTLMNKLKYIRSRKHPNSAEELDADDDEEAAAATSKAKDDTTARKAMNLEERFEQARQKTVKKVNEKMQQMKFFHKSQEAIDKETTTKKTNGSKGKEENDSDDEEATNTPLSISRRSNQDDYQYNSEQKDIEEITNMQPSYVAQKTRAVWTTKNILSDSMESETDSEFPRVLIHQDNSDLFESTLIIAVTRPNPMPMSPTPKVSEITHEKRTPSASPKSIEWIPNTEIISSFLDISPPTKRKQSLEAIVPPPRGHLRKLSMDSNSDSDSWMPEGVSANKQATTQNKEGSRRTSSAGLNSIDEKEEPWKVHSMYRRVNLYKAKSIDIFEANAQRGGAFEDFDDELKNAPIVRIASHLNVDSFERDSSEELDAADDDNSSRVTKILVEAVRNDIRDATTIPTITETKPPHEESQAQQLMCNSRESLIGNFDEDEEMDSGDDDDDLPPSAAPSPPPPHSPPPPPLPQRQPSIRLSKLTAEAVVAAATAAPSPLPPLPKSKPPLPPGKPQVAAPSPPKIPERTASMSRIAKPLVKTSSLRLAYNEQVKPADVGKVNKLISRFEQPQSKVVEIPRLITRRILRADDSEDYSDDYDDDDDDDGEEEEGEEEEEDDEEDDVEEENENKPKKADMRMESDVTPTPTNTPRTNSFDSEESLKSILAVQQQQQTKRAAAAISNSNSTAGRNQMSVPTLMTPTIDEENNQISPIINMQKAKLNLDRNSNLSLPSSEYGSPLEYPSSLIGSTETTPIPDRKQQQQPLQHQQDMRSRRSMTRDDEKFLSFDSDEENSYYSISSSGSSRYVVEI